MKKELPDKKTLIIITGGPGTGKSETAKGLLAYLQNDEIVSLSYDAMKEAAWDRLGFDSEEEKKKVNGIALDAFYAILENHMQKEDTILIEYPFYQFHRPPLQRLIKNYGYTAVTIWLHTDLKTAYERGCRRDTGKARHPGHLLNRYHRENFRPEDIASADRHFLSFESFKKSIDGRDYNLALGITIPVDVTDFRNLSYDDIWKKMTGGR